MKAILQFFLCLGIARLALGHLVSAYYNSAAPGYFPAQQNWNINPTNRIELDNWDHLYIMRGAADHVTGDTGYNFAQRVDSGLSLLDKNHLMTNTVGCVDFINPFPVMLGVTQPPGEPVWSDLHNTFDQQRFIPPEEYFTNCPVLLVPRASNARESVVALLAIYNDYLYAHYSVIDQNASWYLVKQKN